jgi:hypothetical protein
MQKPFYRLEFSRDGIRWNPHPTKKYWNVTQAVEEAVDFNKRFPDSSMKVRVVNGRTRYVLFLASMIKARFGTKL